MKVSQITYLAFSVLVFVGLKLVFRYSTTEDLDWLLYPTNLLFAFFNGTEWQYDSASGYFYPELNILINKSCSGGNFLLISFLTIVFSTIAKSESILKSIVMIVAISLTSYVLAILSNVSRILILFQFNRYGIGESGWTHEAIGGFVYLTILLLAFLSLQLLMKLLENRRLRPNLN